MLQTCCEAHSLLFFYYIGRQEKIPFILSEMPTHSFGARHTFVYFGFQHFSSAFVLKRNEYSTTLTSLKCALWNRKMLISTCYKHIISMLFSNHFHEEWVSVRISCALHLHLREPITLVDSKKNLVILTPNSYVNIKLTADFEKMQRNEDICLFSYFPAGDILKTVH